MIYIIYIVLSISNSLSTLDQWEITNYAMLERSGMGSRVTSKNKHCLGMFLSSWLESSEFNTWKVDKMI